MFTALQTIKREWLVAAGIAASAVVILLCVLSPGVARASGCTDSWTNTAGGNWFVGSNWSKEAPPGPEEEACITAEGTYTVTMTQTSGTVSVHSLTVGAGSGTQTLVVGSSCSLNAVLTTTAGLEVGANGALTLTNGDGCGDGVTLSGPVTNAGKIAIEAEHGGARSLQGSITNTGTIAVNAKTSDNGTSTLLTNKGAIDVASGDELAVSGKNSILNSSGGSISAAGTGGVVLSGSGTTFTQGAGTTSGTEPVIVDDGALKYTGGGKSLIVSHGSSTLSGNLGAAQSLSIDSTCSENAVETAAASFSNAGTITLTNGDGCGDNVTLAITSGTLTSSGKIVTEPANGGQRNLQGNITNKGTVSLKASTSDNGSSATLTNEGALTLAEATALTVSNGSSFTNGTGGSITATGGSDVLMDSGTSFTEGAGTTSGTKPVIVDDGALTYTGEGKSSIAVHGSGTLSGNLGTEQTLSIESTCSENAVQTAAASFSNAGTIKLTNGDGCGDNATLVVSAGTLTNSGKILVEPAIGGQRNLQGNIANTGTVSIKANTSYNGLDALLTNEGALNVAEGTQLTVSNGGSFTNGTGGSITATGGSDVLMDSGTSFTEGAGTTSGTKPVIVDDGALAYTGEGASTIAVHGSGTLSGNLGTEQTLSIESTCSEHAVQTAAASFTNAGNIKLTNGDGCGNNATLVVSAGTLTNSGRIAAEQAIGGQRTIDGNLTNTSTGVLSTKTNTSYNESGALLTNEGTISVSEGTSLTVSGGASVIDGKGGDIFGAGNGALVQTGGTFTDSSGKTSGTEPVILDDLTLDYTGTFAEHGSGRIALRGSSNLSGNVRSGETLAIESTCSEHAVVTAAGSFTNTGKIELTNGDGCGNNATLNLKGGTLTNVSALNIEEPHGGSRTIEGSVVNEATLQVAAGATLQITENYSQTAAGRLKVFVTGSSTFGSLSISGSATLAGTLAVREVAPFKATLGEKFAILKAGSLSGTFATEAEDQITFAGLYYKPTYSSTGVTLEAAQATLALSAKSGSAGSTVTLTGTGYMAGDTITPTFTDSKGVTTTLPAVTTSSSGEYSTEITIPASAAKGGGTIKVTSALTGVHLSASFKVT